MTAGMTDWDDVAINTFGEIVGGGTPSRATPSFWNGTIPWVTPGEIKALPGKYVQDTQERITRDGLAGSAAKLLPVGSVVVTTRATLGEAAIAAVPLTTNQGFKSIIPNEDTDSLFAYYRIQMLKPEMVRLASGTTFLEISKADFSRIRTHRPKRTEQIRIANLLDVVDQAIAKTGAVIAKLRQVRAGLLHDLLARGLDTNGQLRDPVDHPGQFRESPLGRIPQGWRVCGVLDVAPPDRQAILTGPFGAQLGHRDFVSDGIPVLRIGNVQSGFIDWSDTQFVSPSKAIELRRFTVTTGDLLFARQGATTGRNALADKRADGALINYHIIRVATDRTRCEPVFLQALFNTESAVRQINRDKGRGTREGINTAQISDLRFALPSIEEQRLAVAALSQHDGQENSEKATLEKLHAVKAGLMSDLLTGRVRVPEVQHRSKPLDP